MIEAIGIGRRLSDGAWLWRNLTFRIEPGRIVGLIGRNGSGKTTLLRTLLGLISPHEGHTSAAGVVGYVPQISEINFPFAVRDVVAMARARNVRLFAGLARRDHIVIRDAMERVGISHLANRIFLELSGGERQLVLIARAVAGECGILILDEPFGGLDLENQRQTLALIRKLSRDDGVGVIFSAHQPDHLFAVAEHALVLRRGAEAIQGPVADILTSDLLSNVYGVDVRLVEFERIEGRSRHAVPQLSIY